MAAVALILFDQGGPGTAGVAFIGTVAGGAVTVTNDDDTDVQSWSIDLLDVPPDSALVPGNLAMADSGTPSAMFTPDVPGSYRVKLDVWDAPAQAGVRDRDIRCFGIRNARGLIIPPYQKNPDPLPLQGSGLPGEKPDEQNYTSQARGWAGDRAVGQMEQFIETYDDLPSLNITSTPFTAAVTNEEPLYYVDLVAIGSAASFTLPTPTRVGQRFRVIAGAGSSDLLTINPPGGHNIDGLATVDMLSGSTGSFVWRGGMNWSMLAASRDRYERTVVGGTEDTDTTGWTSIGVTALNPDLFVNIQAITWQGVIETTDAGDAAEIRLFNITDTAVVGGSTLSTTSLTPVLVSATVTLPAGLKLYEAQLRLATTGAPNRATCKQAQLVIDWLQP